MAKYNKRVTTSYGVGQPLIESFPAPVLSSRPPTSEDRGPDGLQWIDQLTNKTWILTRVSGNESNWEILGGQGLSATSEYVVAADGTGDFVTIQDAIDASTAGLAADADIFLRPGTYIENLVFDRDISIRSANNSATIVGLHTPSATGNIRIDSCTLSSATHIFNSAAAGTGTIELRHCITAVTAGYTFNLTAWTGDLYISSCGNADTNNGILNNAGAATIFINNSNVGSGANVFTSDGTIIATSSIIGCPITLTGALASSFASVDFSDTVIIGGTTDAEILYSSFDTGADVALTHTTTGDIILNKTSINTSSNPAINGAGGGNLTLASVTFLDSATLAGTLVVISGDSTRGSKYLCGDSTHRLNEFSGDNNVMQVYVSDTTPTGGGAFKAIQANLESVAGDGNHTATSLVGNNTALSGSNVVGLTGLITTATQNDGSSVGTIGSGIQARYNILELDAADLPSIYMSAVKGLLSCADGTAPTTTTHVGGFISLLSYAAAFDDSGCGYIASRQIAGTGASALAAFKVAQGTVAQPDWKYGLDLYNGATGIPFDNADIRFRNETILSEDAEGIICSGDITARNLSAINTNLVFDSMPICSNNSTIGGAPSGATGAVNLMACQQGVILEQFIIGAGQTIIAPEMTDDGLKISLDLTATEGAEYNFGTTALAKHIYISDGGIPFFVEAVIKINSVDGANPVVVGLRSREANNAVFTAYNDLTAMGVQQTAYPGSVAIWDRSGGGGLGVTNTTDPWAAGETHTLRIDVDGTGACTYLLDGVAPSGVAVFSFPALVEVIPYISILHGAAGGGPGNVYLLSLSAGVSSYTT